jgi:glutamine amidotransferase-like uncharacterized protein
MMKKFALLLLWPFLLNAETAVIFAGAGTCEGCASTVAALLQQRNYQVHLVDEHQLGAEVLRQADLYVQPGGSDDIMDTLSVLSARQIQAIRDFVAQGGSYLGICAGAYLAGQYADQDAGIRAFGLVELTEIEQELADDNQAKWIRISVPPENRPKQVYYQAGPHFGRQIPSTGKVTAVYAASKQIAARISSFGKGKVALIGPHYEADIDWFTADELPLSFPLQQVLLFQMLQQLQAK